MYLGPCILTDPQKYSLMVCSYSNIYMWYLLASSEDAEKNDDNSKEGMVNLKIGSRIKHGSRYGIIKWIGNLVGLSDEKYAGIEMVGNVISSI